MPHRARRAAVVAIPALAAGLVLGGGAPRAEATALDCRHVASIHPTRLAGCIDRLQDRADAAGRRAAQADEVYLRSKLATDTAQNALATAETAARRAAARAVQSRARAAVVAVQLSHGAGAVGQTATVLLDGGRARTMLYHLSRISELGVDSGRLARAALQDKRAAELTSARADDAAERLADVERTARAAYTKAKRESDVARRLVVQAEVRKDGGNSERRVPYIDLPADAPTAAKVVAFARSQIGKPYVFGGAGPSIWDCSGLTMMAFEAVGRSIGGHSSNSQYHLAEADGELVPYSAAEPGDLVFYGSGDLYHVAVYSGGGNMIEAPYPGRSVREVPVRTADLAPMVARYTG